MMDGEFVEKLLEAQHSIENIEGHDFHVNSEKATPVVHPSFETLHVLSLTQVVSWLKLNAQAVDETKLLLNVDSHCKVQVHDEGYDDNRKLERFVCADFSKTYQPFPFGEKLSQEDFILALQTRFLDCPNRAALIKLVGNLRQEKVQVSEDDGISQVAASRAGVTLVERQAVPNLWKLKTFATFPELEQPEIQYVLRLHQRDDEMPKFALYESDGGKWKVDTAIAVREWLVNRLRNELAEHADKVVVL